MSTKLKAIGSGIVSVAAALAFGAYELHATVHDFGIHLGGSKVPSAECVIRTTTAGHSVDTLYRETCSSVQNWDSARYNDSHNTVVDTLPTTSPACNVRVPGHDSTIYPDSDDDSVTANGICDALKQQGLTY